MNWIDAGLADKLDDGQARAVSVGRRTIAVRVDKSRGDLRPPLAGRPVMLLLRNGEFELWAADIERDPDDF